MLLRRRLIFLMAVLLVIGLAVSDVVTYTSLRSFLYGRLDDQLATSQDLAVRFLVHAEAHHYPLARWEEALDDRLSPEVYVLVLSPGGRLLVTRPSGSPENPDPIPVVPRSVRLAPDTQPAVGPYRPDPDDFNLSSKGGRGVRVVDYRARAAAVPQGRTVVTAVALTDTDATLTSLVRIELAVSAAVLLVLCGIALWTVRRGLRPLEDMATTAGAIASGDLSRRIESIDPTTEVGRLGDALNVMLAQIEAGFAEKSATEARLRQFVADASHELRTPLTSIRGYAELLRKGALPSEEERLRALRRVEHEASRMSGLVDDLLLLARLDQGRPLERVPVDLRRACRDAVDDARLADPDRPIALHARAPVVVAGDRDRLAQVAHNLVRNALEHTPASSPVEVDVSKEGAMGVLRVVDHGPGLPAQRLEQVFDRFYRGSSARTGQGTGLGLAIVRAIAEALGGRAWAERPPGGGTVFAVQIPLAEPVPAGPAPVGGPAPAPAPDGARGGPVGEPVTVSGGPTGPAGGLRAPGRA